MEFDVVFRSREFLSLFKLTKHFMSCCRRCLQNQRWGSIRCHQTLEDADSAGLLDVPQGHISTQGLVQFKNYLFQTFIHFWLVPLEAHMRIIYHKDHNQFRTRVLGSNPEKYVIKVQTRSPVFATCTQCMSSLVFVLYHLVIALPAFNYCPQMFILSRWQSTRASLDVCISRKTQIIQLCIQIKDETLYIESCTTIR